MSSSTKTFYRKKRRRWLQYVGLLLVALTFLVGIFCIRIGMVRIVPPVSVKVVDAVTGNPVPGVNVCLQLAAMNFGGLGARRTEVSTTSASGSAFFWPSVHTDILPAWRGYWIRVTDADAQIAPTCGAYIGEMDLDSAKGWPISRVPDANGRPKYFPVALLRGEGDHFFHRWGAMNRTMGSPLGVRIALIPVLRTATDCNRIPDASLIEDCRQLNTYAAAMAMRKLNDSVSWGLAEKLCDEVDHSFYSATCKGVFNRATRSRHARMSNPNYDPAYDPYDE